MLGGFRLFDDIVSVGCWCLGIGQLHSDEATFDVGVLNALHVAVLDPRERHVLVVEIVVVFNQVGDKLFRVHVRLLLHIEVLVEEELVLLINCQCIDQHLLRLVVE